MITLMFSCTCSLLQQNLLSPRTPKPLTDKNRCCYGRQRSNFVVLATKGSTKSSKSDKKIPSWARPDSDEPIPWARDGGKESGESTVQIPYIAYLLASAFTAIAAIGSSFEYANKKPVFGLLNSDSIFYLPLLGFFVSTGMPTSAYLWYKAVQLANKEAEEQDRRDGYM